MTKKETDNTNHDFDWFKKIMTQIFICVLSVLGGICCVLILYFVYCWIQYTILTFEQCGMFFRILALLVLWYGTSNCYTFLTNKFLPTSAKKYKEYLDRLKKARDEENGV